MTKPAAVVPIWDLPAERRPRFIMMPGVGAMVRQVSDAGGLTQMGIHLRVIEPGILGTLRHFHTVEEEWVYVLSGGGAVRIGPHRLPVRAGSFVGFPPGPRPHHFFAEGDEPLVLLEGGERRPAEDTGCYVDIPKWWHGGNFLESSEPPPPDEGDESQCVLLDDVPAWIFQHDVDAGARRRQRGLSRRTGLVRQAVAWSRVDAGARSTAWHTHDRTDEWVLILSGRARLRLGDEQLEVARHDFVAHPAGGPPHTMEALEPLEYLMGGQIDDDDVVLYPDAGLRRVRGELKPL